ncbi:methenyltetrahydrofolate cyclohydrolase [Paenibacillus selenitireducens]|jgi:formiminotetrahydrofolate cyclodeaminase|uniref:Methenyltetrahydrofolate cyclohydrolase n=1 Tax=Paenibacillus selenitireducens TaxID=1324314 RepID=A0A1T2XAN2_9BACL|nr:cyclodeaminase/cyclohydrolase family protein [Paenibacillus selenitireducens]OPA76862.1 methenyltetrahydrofolate cyclohydrolase [Paenibacillus selenitireducens]
MSIVTWDHSIRSFVEEASSAEPTPGGGSVAALIGALAASMTSMVGNLSQGEKYIAYQDEMNEVLAKMERLIGNCEELLASDITSFQQYMDALKLPKGTDEEKEARKQAIQTATLAAIQVPLRLMEVCREGMQWTWRIAETSNKNVISDLGIGAILFEAAAQSALLTVEINLASLKDEALKQQYEVQASAWMQEMEALKRDTLRVVRSRM